VGKLVGGKNMSWSIGMMKFPTEGEKNQMFQITIFNKLRVL
jgi:hypothetical protein